MSSTDDEDDYVPARAPRRFTGFSRTSERRRDKETQMRREPRFFRLENEIEEEKRFRHIRTYDYDSNSSDDFGDEPRRLAYSFQIVRPEFEATEDEGSSDDSVAAPLDADAVARRIRTVSDVCESRFTGSGDPGGVHGARMTVVQGGQGRAKPLFRWVHFPWDVMSFDDFSAEVSQTPGLTTTERNTLADLLNEVRHKHSGTLRTKGSTRPMLPCCIQMELPSDSRRKTETSTPRSATWICLPYLSLEPYAGPDVVAAQPLLRARYSKAGRERDMQQAICRLKQAPPGYCFHIAQLWCLVLDNSLLFTCYRSSERTLFGESIQRSLQPTQDATGAISNNSKMTIRVCFRGSVMWSLPVEECSTWLNFISHFREAWPRRLVFFRHKRRVTASEWPKIFRVASRASVTLELRIGKRPALPKNGVLIRPQGDDMSDDDNSTEPPAYGPQSGLSRNKGPSSSTQPAQTSAHATPQPGLAIFTFIDSTISPQDSGKSPVPEKNLAAVHEYLLRRTSFADRKQYASCPESSRTKLYRQIKERDLILSSSLDEVTQYQSIDDQIDLFNIADILFSFFLPRSAGMATASRFWGALGRCIEARPEEEELYSRMKELPTAYRCLDLCDDLRPLATTMVSFAEVFRHATKEDRAKVRVPDEMMQAWIHILMSLVYSHADWIKARSILEDAKSLLDDGMRDIVMAMSERTLLEHSVVLPLELVSLVSSQLIRNPTPGLPSVSDTYFSYLSAINDEIDSRPVDRSRERQLWFLRQEIDLVQRTISSQASIFDTLLRASRSTLHGPRAKGRGRRRVIHRSTEWVRVHEGRPHSRAPSPMSAADEDLGSGKLSLAGIGAGGFRELLLRECLAETSKMKADFNEIMRQALDLEGYNQNKLETTKDRQERAIYAFTIVTVIFLPLSAVSSIFGMNTVDIRDMNLGQWAYWAAAIPVTLLVIFLGLLFTGELRNLAAWAFGTGFDEDPHMGGGKPMSDGNRRLYRENLDDRFEGGVFRGSRSKRRAERGAYVDYDL